MRVDAPDSPGQVPAIPGVAARTDATAADLVPVADRSATGACKKLAEDAAQTTLMVVEFQRWYSAQKDAASHSNRLVVPQAQGTLWQ